MLGLRVKLLAALPVSYGGWQGFQTACWNFKGSLRCELFDSRCKEKFKNPCRTGQSKLAETVRTCVSWEAELGVGGGAVLKPNVGRQLSANQSHTSYVLRGYLFWGVKLTYTINRQEGSLVAGAGAGSSS